MTPQVIQNDLKRGACPSDELCLLVCDEAHRATGAYSYAEVVKELSGRNESFRVLALTATPGADLKAVQEVVSNLNIARIEIRTVCLNSFLTKYRKNRLISNNTLLNERCRRLLSSPLKTLSR
jgi:ERCC4-related helicase